MKITNIRFTKRSSWLIGFVVLGAGELISGEHQRKAKSQSVQESRRRQPASQQHNDLSACATGKNEGIVHSQELRIAIEKNRHTSRQSLSSCQNRHGPTQLEHEFHDTVDVSRNSASWTSPEVLSEETVRGENPRRGCTANQLADRLSFTPPIRWECAPYRTVLLV